MSGYCARPRVEASSADDYPSVERLFVKAVILAGGVGSRLAEETVLRPKPMVEIGGRPIIWHIMKTYSHHGINEFIICLGYKGYLIKEYFVNFVLHHTDVTVDLERHEVIYHDVAPTPWRVTLVETGETSMTGGRLARIGKYLAPNETFCMTYGDGLSDIDITALTAFHEKQKVDATVTVVQTPGRFGSVRMRGASITEFVEKPPSDSGHINGGFFVLNRRVLDRIADDQTVWEQEPLASLARDRQLAGYQHRGFWQPMDTLRDRTQLEALWATGKAPWKVWE